MDLRELFEECDTLIFDLDGTLVDSSLDIVRAAVLAARQHGLAEFDADSVGPLIGQPPYEFFRHLAEDEQVPAIVSTFRSELAQARDPQTRVAPGAPDFLRLCRERGKMLAVASNKTETLIHLTLERLELLEFFTTLVGTDRLPPKPHPGTILTAMEGCRSGRAMMIGDTWMDITAGRNAGVATVAVSALSPHPDDLTKADYVAQSMSQMAAILRSGEK